MKKNENCREVCTIEVICEKVIVFKDKFSVKRKNK